MKKKLTRLFSVLLAAVLVLGTLPVSAMGTDVADPPASAVDDTPAEMSAAEPEEASVVDETPDGEKAQSGEVEAAAVQSIGAVEGYKMNTFFLDCGRKYYSVDSIKQLIDNASAAGFNYIQLAVGNDGMRLLLDDMSLTVGDKTYSSDAVKTAVHNGNVAYDNEKKYSTNVDELTQSQMNEIIAYAQSKKMGVIPCVNTPGHMDAILAAATSLTDTTCSYKGSVRTIDVTNTTATAFTKAFLQKYITYFSDRGCKYFNMGADEYANDIYTTGSMGFGNLQDSKKYSYYVTYVNEVAKLIENADMTPMAFNDGIYFKNDTSSGTFDSKIVICYWSQGWGGYTPATAGYLQSKGHKLVNTHGDYYWVLGKSNAQCSADTASEFGYNAFARQANGDEQLNGTLGSMFCIWSDYPNAMEEATVVSKSADTIQAFGGACPTVENVTETPVDPNKITITVGSNNGNDTSSDNTLTIGAAISMYAPKEVDWTASNDNVVITSTDENVAPNGADTAVRAATVNVEAVKAGEVTITATDPSNSTNKASVTLDVQDKETEDITVAKGESVTVHVDGIVTVGTGLDETIATATTKSTEATAAAVTEIKSQADLKSGDQLFLVNIRTGTMLTNMIQSGGITDFIGLELVGKPSAEDPTHVWTWSETASGTGTGSLKHGDEDYLNIGNKMAWVSSSAASIKLAYNSTGGYWTISQDTYYLNQFGGTDESAKGAAGWNGSGASTDAGSQWKIYKYTPAAAAGTDITFKGIAPGTTTVEIGDVTYNITVDDEVLPDVTPLPIEYWVTNSKVTAGGAFSKEINITDRNVHTENGAAISDLVPAKGTQNEHPTVFKQARMLDAKRSNSSTSGTELQTDVAGDDETQSGTEFTKIRYWNNKWQVYTTENEWIDVNTTQVSVNSYTGTQSQLVAYHMQRTTVTEEITTDVTDWGHNVGEVNWYPYDYVELDFAVKYENGLRTPNAFPVAGKTMEFHAHSDTTDGEGFKHRRIGRIDAIETSEYEVYMITLTPTSDDRNEILSSGSIDRPSSYEYKGTEKVVWVDDVANLGDFADTRKQAPQFHAGGDPTIEYVNIYSRQGMLVTYYVRTKPTQDALTVYYVDEGSGVAIYDYSIAVAKGTTFDENIALASDWKGPLVNGTVQNLQGHDITVSADLLTMPAIQAGYRYANYTCTGIARSTDGRTLTLYYNFSTSVSFVVDFGTPLNISLADVNKTLATQSDGITSVVISGVTHGTAKLNDDKSITYTPDSRFTSSKTGEQLTVTYSGKNSDGTEGGISYTVYIYPASNVLYEEGFLTGAEGWKQEGSAKNDAQATGKAKTADQNYGYDTTYSSLARENGVYKADELTTSKATKALTTSFYGNTFDLIGNCGKDTGRVVAMLTRTSGPKKVFIIDVDTRYNGGTIYQVPLMHKVLGDSDASYNVEIYASGLAESDFVVNNKVMAASEMPDGVTASDDILTQILADKGLTMDDVEYTSTSVAEELAESDASGEAANNVKLASEDGNSTTVHHVAGTHVEIDSFRVYRSTSDTDAVAQNYDPDEQNVTYARALDVVKNQIVAYTEANSSLQVSVQDYEAKGGPQNEIYLGKEQSIFFQSTMLVDKEIQVSLRAVNTSATAKVNSSTIELASNTEMYYTLKADATGKVTIVNNGTGLLAIGNVKLPKSVTTDSIQSASEAGDEAVITALKSVLYTDEETEVFTPETFTAKTTVTPVVRNKMVTLKVNVSSDVAYITVNGVKYTRTGLQGLFRKTRTIRVVNTVKKGQTKTYEVVAYNADGVASETITVTG